MKDISEQRAIIDLDQVSLGDGYISEDMMNRLWDMISLPQRPDLHLAGEDPLVAKVYEEVKDLASNYDIDVRTFHPESLFPKPTCGKSGICKPGEGSIYVDFESHIASEDKRKVRILCGPETNNKLLAKMVDAIVLMEYDVDLVTEELEAKAVEKDKRVAIIGGGSLAGIGEQAMRIIRETHGFDDSSYCTSYDWWHFPTEAKIDKPPKDWIQAKLRRGKGHNKLKSRKKGKK